MKFTKMQGIGNDYVYVDCFEETLERASELAVKISNRNFGIGSDGLILICPSEVADCRMEMYNLDGSLGIMCGNGIRCVGKYVYDHGLVDKTDMTVETEAGVKRLKLSVEDGKVAAVTVNIGKPVQTSRVGESIEAGGAVYRYTGVSVGNPHAVLFWDDLEGLDIGKIGPLLENHPNFPDKTNVEFVRVIDKSHVEMRVWERGSGETLACGTGACAVAAACALNGKTGETVDVRLLGGTLHIKWDRDQDLIYMTGPAVEVYSGEIDLERL